MSNRRVLSIKPWLRNTKSRARCPWSITKNESSITFHLHWSKASTYTWLCDVSNSHLQPWQKAIYMRLQRKSTNTTSKWTIVSVPPKPNKHHKNKGRNLECHTVPDHPLHHEWQWLAAISPDQPSAPHNKYPLLYDTLQTIIQQSTPEGFCSISGWNSNTVSWC